MALAIDGTTPAVASGNPTATSTSFTPPSASLLLVLTAGDTIGGSNPGIFTITDNLGVHLTYTLTDWQSHVDSPAVSGQAAGWVANVATSAAMTTSVTNNDGSTRDLVAKTVVLTGQHATTPLGTHGKTGSASVLNIAQNFTATASGSWGWLVVCDWDALGTPTAGTGCTRVDGGTVVGISYAVIRRTTADGTNGGTTTMNCTLAGTSTNATWVWVEVVPVPAATGPTDGIKSNPIHPGLGPTFARFISRAMSTDPTGSGPASQPVAGNAIDTNEAFGNSVITASTTISDNAIPSVETFGNTTISRTAPVNGTASAEVFGLATISETVPVNGVNSNEVLGNAAITTITTITDNAIPSVETFGNTTVSITVPINGIGSGEALGNALTSPVVAENSIATNEKFGAPSVTTTYTINAYGIPSNENSGLSNTTTASSINANAVSSSETFGATTVSTNYTIQANAIPTSETFGSDILTLNVIENGITSAEKFGAPTITVITAINENSIPSNEQLGAATVTTTYTINVGSIPSSELSGNSNVTTAISVLPGGLASSEVLGGASVSASATITAGSIPDTGGLGSPTANLFITPGGIASTEKSGATAITTTAPSINGFSISSAEQFGATTVTQTVSAGGISSTEKSGSSNIGTTTNISSSSINSNELFGAIQLVPGSITRNTQGIITGESFGNHMVTLGAPTLTIIAYGISSNERLGYPHTGASVMVDVTTTLAPDSVLFINDEPILVVVSVDDSIIYRD